MVLVGGVRALDELLDTRFASAKFCSLIVLLLLQLVLDLDLLVGDLDPALPRLARDPDREARSCLHRLIDGGPRTRRSSGGGTAFSPSTSALSAIAWSKSLRLILLASTPATIATARRTSIAAVVLLVWRSSRCSVRVAGAAGGDHRSQGQGGPSADHPHCVADPRGTAREPISRRRTGFSRGRRDGFGEPLERRDPLRRRERRTR